MHGQTEICRLTRASRQYAHLPEPDDSGKPTGTPPPKTPPGKDEPTPMPLPDRPLEPPVEAPPRRPPGQYVRTLQFTDNSGKGAHAL